jgi:hypothetical protein
MAFCKGIGHAYIALLFQRAAWWGKLHCRREALEFDSLASAEHAAALTASELGMDRARKGNTAGHEVVVEVRDEQHQRVAMVTAGMRIERLTPSAEPFDPWSA